MWRRRRNAGEKKKTTKSAEQVYSAAAAAEAAAATTNEVKQLQTINILTMYSCWEIERARKAKKSKNNRYAKDSAKKSRLFTFLKINE